MRIKEHLQEYGTKTWLLSSGTQVMCKNISDLRDFQTFLRLCAGRAGQSLVLSSLSNELGVSHNTVKSWISVLEASYLIFLLKPYYKNMKKTTGYITQTILCRYRDDNSPVLHYRCESNRDTSTTGQHFRKPRNFRDNQDLN